MKEIPEVTKNELLSAYFYMAQELDQIKDYSRELAICKEWRQHLDYIKALEKPGVGKMNVYDMEQHLWYASALIGSDSLATAAKELAACEQLNEQIKDPYLTYQMQVHQARLAMKEGDIKKAVAFTDLYEPMMDLDWWPMAQRLRGEALLAVGRNREAAILYQKMYLHKDSTFSKDVRMQLDELNTLFQVDEIRMKGQLERSRFVILIICLIMLVLLLFIYLRHRAAKRLAQKNQELMIANARAEESSKMKTAFIQQISHEFRTPLNILNGFTQILTAPDMVLQTEEKADIQKRISESTERITSLVNKMLELSDANSRQVIERNDSIAALMIATQAIEHTGIQQDSHIKFQLQADAQAEAIMHTNLQSATRALTLLLDNARKFTKKGEVRLIIQQQPGTFDFIVEDTGIGVPAQEAEHIFDEFVQLDEYYDGTGIGLTVARSIARRLGGDIVLDTSYSGGARFVMSLPKE
jgi:signal transduction histidine kinase